jgi:hypothetical protein
MGSGLGLASDAGTGVDSPLAKRHGQLALRIELVYGSSRSVLRRCDDGLRAVCPYPVEPAIPHDGVGTLEMVTPCIFDPSCDHWAGSSGGPKLLSRSLIQSASLDVTGVDLPRAPET